PGGAPPGAQPARGHRDQSDGQPDCGSRPSGRVLEALLQRELPGEVAGEPGCERTLRRLAVGALPVRPRRSGYATASPTLIMRVRHPVPLPVVLLALFALPAAAAARQATPPAGSDPIILDASDFIHEIQKNHVLTDAASLDVPWIFNNTALEMRTRSNYLIRVPVAEAGRYYLYARTHGSEGSYFRIAVGDRVIEENVGDAPLRFERVGAFDLPAGEVDVRLMRIEGRPVLDVLVLSRRDDITVEELRGWQLDREVRLLREYDIPASNAVKFGDLTGDGQIDFLVLTRGYSAHAFDHQGNLLWSWEAPAGGERLRAEFEAPGVVWDL